MIDPKKLAAAISESYWRVLTVEPFTRCFERIGAEIAEKINKGELNQ